MKGYRCNIIGRHKNFKVISGLTWKDVTLSILNHRTIQGSCGPFPTFLSPNIVAELLERPLSLPSLAMGYDASSYVHQLGLPDSLPKAALFLCGNRAQLPNVDKNQFFLRWLNSPNSFSISLDIYASLPFNHLSSFPSHLNQWNIWVKGCSKRTPESCLSNSPKIMYERSQSFPLPFLWKWNIECSN